MAAPNSTGSWAGADPPTASTAIHLGETDNRSKLRQ
jgi:hypothetical protein